MADETVGSTKAAKGQDEEVETSPKADQHPALRGNPETEVEQRSADGADGKTFYKTFVLSGSVDKDNPQHEANCTRVLEEAIQRALHPKGKARLISVKQSDPDRRGTVSTECTYAVAVEPAVTDDKAPETVTPSKDVVEKQRSLTES